MDFEVRKEGSTLTIILGRKLDINNAPALQDELARYSGQGIERVVFDATGLIYISSAGLRCVFFAFQNLGGQPAIVFINCASELYKVLDLVGLTSFIQFEESLERKKDYRISHMSDLSTKELEQHVSERKKGLDEFATNNDVVCYNMKLGQEDD